MGINVINHGIFFPDLSYPTDEKKQAVKYLVAWILAMDIRIICLKAEAV